MGFLDNLLNANTEKSKSKKEKILEEYNLSTGMEMTIWDSEKYFPESFREVCNYIFDTVNGKLYVDDEEFKIEKNQGGVYSLSLYEIDHVDVDRFDDKEKYPAVFIYLKTGKYFKFRIKPIESLRKLHFMKDVTYDYVAEFISEKVEARKKFIGNNQSLIQAEEKRIQELRKQSKESTDNIINERNKEIESYIKNGIGIELEVPSEVMVNKHGTATKIAGTAIFGLVGLAATSGVKKENTIEKVLTTLKIGKEEFIIKDLRIPFSSINSITEDEVTYLNVIITYNDFYSISFSMVSVDYCIMKLLIEELNKIVDGTSQIEYCNSTGDTNENNQLEQLEKLGNLRDNGVITEEEFIKLKEEILN